MRPTADELAPDGLPVFVPWGDIHIGESIFVPCINQSRCKAQITRIAATYGMAFKYRTRVEHGILGLRAWRTA